MRKKVFLFVMVFIVASATFATGPTGQRVGNATGVQKVRENYRHALLQVSPQLDEARVNHRIRLLAATAELKSLLATKDADVSVRQLGNWAALLYDDAVLGNLEMGRPLDGFVPSSGLAAPAAIEAITNHEPNLPRGYVKLLKNELKKISAGGFVTANQRLAHARAESALLQKRVSESSYVFGNLLYSRLEERVIDVADSLRLAQSALAFGDLRLAETLAAYWQAPLQRAKLTAQQRHEAEALQQEIDVLAVDNPTPQKVESSHPASNRLWGDSNPFFGQTATPIWKAENGPDGTLEYHPVLDLPANIVVDEILLDMRKKSGFALPERDDVISISCQGTPSLSFTDTQATFWRNAQVSGRVLTLRYAFADRAADHPRSDSLSATEGAALNLASDCWRIKIKGGGEPSNFHPTSRYPYSDIRFVVTYHIKDVNGLLDYYKASNYDSSAIPFDPSGTWHKIGLDDLTDEAVCLPAHGTKVGISDKKLIVIVHGWNSDDNQNNFGVPKRDGSTCSAQTFVDKEIDFKWLWLERRLLNNPVVQQDWAVTRFDWSRDASTGGISNPNDNSNASRDAAMANGLKLGRLLAKGNPTDIMFVAHSAGNWVVGRASEFLRKFFGKSITMQIVALDPFVNDNDDINGFGSSGLDFSNDFNMFNQWLNRTNNYWVVDSLSSDVLGWTSGAYPDWDQNQNLEEFGLDHFFDESFMDSHGGPVYWYGSTVGSGSTNSDDFGFARSLPIFGPNDDDHAYNFTAAETIAVDSTTPGRIDPLNNKDFFRFDVQQVGTWIVQTLGNTDTVGRLYDGDQKRIAFNDNGGSDRNFKITANLAPGTYFVQVNSAHYASMGNYVLSSTLSSDQHGDSCDTATNTFINGTDTGRIDPKKDLDFFRLDVPESGTLTVLTTGDTDTSGRLYDASCSRIASNTDSGSGDNFRIVKEVAAGTHYVRVNSSFFRSTGDYTIQNTLATVTDLHGNSCDTATPVSVNATANGRIDPDNDKDYFRLDVSESGTLTVQTTGSTDTSGRLYDGACHMIASNSNSGAGSNFKIVKEVAPGTHYVRVNTANFGSTGDYIFQSALLSAGKPDLIVVSPSASDTTPSPDQSFTLRATVKNQGASTSNATTLRYYRSSNSNITTSDTQLATDSVAGLGANGASPESASVSVPAGTWWLGACVDGVAGESSTSNNCSSGVQVVAEESQLPTDVAAYYPLDGNANDAAPVAHNGTIFGGMTFTSGVLGQAANLDGIDDYISIAANSALPSGTSVFSMSVWVKTTDSRWYIFDARVTGERGYSLASVNGTIGFAVQSGGSAFQSVAANNSEIADGVWHNMIGIRDGAGIRLYIDGAQVATMPGNPVNMGSANKLFVGKRFSASSGDYFDGLMDEIRIYNRALTSAEIGALAGRSPQPPPTAFRLTVSKSGAGTVTSNPSGINCGSDCQQDYSPNQTVTLSATATSGWTFDSWSGSCSGSSTSCTVNMNANKSVTAKFMELVGGTGDVRANLVWSNTDDLDLHCIDACGQEISFDANVATCQGFVGELDVDANHPESSAVTNPAENIVWANGAASGNYECWVKNYTGRNAGSTSFTLRLFKGNQQSTFNGSLADQKESSHYQFTVP